MIYKKRNLFESYEDFARSIYQKTGLNGEIEVIVPKAHYSMLLEELSHSPFCLDEPKNSPYFLKVRTSVLTFKIKYNDFSDLK